MTTPPSMLVEILKEKDAPHVPAAFINAIAEGGTKAEAVQWLQKEWNEHCRTKEALAQSQAECAELRGYLTGSNGEFLALRKDAERYRWLQSQVSNHGGSLDAKIDAALKEPR